jgi:hypothetical protein
MGVSDAYLSSPGLLLLKSKDKLPVARKRSRPLLKKCRRQVRFDVRADQVEELSPRLTEKSTLWWTKEDRQDFLEDNRRAAQDFRWNHRDQVQQYNQVFDQCCDEADSSDDDDDAETLNAKMEVPTQVRGLEWGIMPASKKYRRTHVRLVLKMQNELQDLPSDKKQCLLSAQAVQSSRPSRVMARMLAQGDAATKQESSPTLRRSRCRMLPSWW